MGILGLILSLFGAGTAAAKSEHDARAQMNSQYVKEIDEERKWLEQKPTGMYRQCYNRVLEFDVAHAEVRKMYAEMDQERLRKWEELGIAIAVYGPHGFLRQCCERPNYSSYESRWSIDLAEKNGIYEQLKERGFDPNSPDIEDVVRKRGRRNGRIKAVAEWFKTAHPDYAAVRSPTWYNAYTYIREVARKTAYDNGYYPSNYKPGRIHSGFPTVYDGRHLCGVCDEINFMDGIPNQEERARLAQLDIDYPR